MIQFCQSQEKTLNIYFSCSITGGRSQQQVYAEIVKFLINEGHEVPTAHLASEDVIEKEIIADAPTVYKRDIGWVRGCDVLVAEVSTPSHGVGYEIAAALYEGKPVLCCHEKKYTIMDHTKEKFSVGGDYKEAPPPPRPRTIKSDRILHIEDDMVPGSFYVDFVWIWEGTGGAPAPEHTHEWPELIAMAGADPNSPHDLGGEMSIVLGDEYHPTTKSTLVCIPAGLKHCPWEFHDIKKPTLVFSAGPQGMYSGSHKK